MDNQTLVDIKQKIEEVEASGHGEVVIKIKNGYVWRVLQTFDKKLLDKV